MRLRPLSCTWVAVALLSTVVASSATASTGSGGVVSIAGFEQEEGQVEFLVSADGLPSGAGISPDEVQVAFRSGANPPVPLEAMVVVASDAGSDIQQTVMLAVDTSGSLGPEGIEAVKAAANSFLDTVPPSVGVGLVTFGSPPSEVAAPTSDRQVLRDAIAGLTAGGDTALYDAVIDSVALLPEQGVTRILLLTDGEDDNANGGVPGGTTLEDALAAVTASRVLVTAVAFGESAALDDLEALATGAGGVVDANDPAALNQAFAGAGTAIAQSLTVTAVIPENLRGQRGYVEVLADSPAGAVSTRRFVTLTAGATPSVEPSATLAPPDPLDPQSPRFDLTVGSLGLYAGLAGLFLALLTVSVVLVGLVRRASGVEAQRRRSLEVYSMRGAASPKLVDSESATATKLGNNAVARSAVELAGRVVDTRGTDKLARKLDAASVPLRPAEWTVLRVAIAVGLGLLLLLVSAGNVLAMLAGLLLGAILPPAYLSIKRSRREKAFLQVLPDTLGLMASGLRAGYSMPQAMDSVVREGREPLRTEFNRALVEARLGVPAEDALEGIADRMNSNDFRWVVMAIRIQREVGGNLAELMDTVAATLRERARLRRQVDVLSAEGRLSAWIVGLLPVAFALYLLVVQPDYLRPLVTEPLGIFILVTSLVIFGIGILGLRWAVKVEV